MSDIEPVWRLPWRETTSESFDQIAERARPLWDDEDDGEPLNASDDESEETWTDDDYAAVEEEYWTRVFVVREHLRTVEAAHQRHEFAPDDPDPDQLRAMFRDLEYESEGMRRRPAGWKPDPAMAARIWRNIVVSMHLDEAISKTPEVRPLRSLDDILPRELSPVELQHWRWLVAHRTQQEIASDLGVTQKTVSKREAKLRARVDQLAIAYTGRPYPWLRIRHGGRPRKG